MWRKYSDKWSEDVSTEVFFSAAEEMRILLYSLLPGVLLSVLYDVVRLVRMQFRCHKAVTFALDMLFMLLSSLCFFVFSVMWVRGQLRFFVVCGFAIGFALWHFTLGNAVVFVLNFLLNRLRRLAALPFKFILNRSKLRFACKEKKLANVRNLQRER